MDDFPDSVESAETRPETRLSSASLTSGWLVPRLTHNHAVLDLQSP